MYTKHQSKAIQWSRETGLFYGPDSKGTYQLDSKVGLADRGIAGITANPRHGKKKPYRAVLYLMNERDGRLSAYASRPFRTHESAARQCERWMHSHGITTTRYLPASEDVACAAVVDDRRGAAILEEFTPEIDIVPSVGELGYW